MKIVAITGPRQCAVVDRPDPVIRPPFVRVRIDAAPMCTEFKQYAGGGTGDCLGHEAAGTVIESFAGAGVGVGRRVVVMPQSPCGLCDLCLSGDYIHCEHTVDPLAVCGSKTGTATYAQQMVQQDWLTLPLPDDISTDHAAMACCGLGPTFGAMHRMNVAAGDTLLIVGLGPVGLGGIINGVYRNARVIGVDSNPYRAKVARDLGAADVLDPADHDVLDRIRSMTGGRGVACAVDCTAIFAAQKLAIDATRRRGQVAFVGWGGKVELGNMVPPGLTLHGIWHWNLTLAPRMFRLIRDVGPSIDRMITHRFPMSRVREAFDLQITGQCGKVMLQPQV